MTKLNSILKSRDIILPTMVHLFKAMVFPVVMYGGERWTIKKAEHQRIDALELWCWRSLLRNLYTVRKQQLELDMEQQTGSKKEKEFVKAVYCHPPLHSK